MSVKGWLRGRVLWVRRKLQELWLKDNAPQKAAVDVEKDRVLAESISSTPSKWVFGLLVVGFLVVAGKAAWLQCGFQTDFLQRQGEARYAVTLETAATRGRILDRNGTVLATTKQIRDISANPSQLSLATPEQWEALAEALGMTVKDIREKIDGKKGRHFVYLKRKIDVDTGDRIRKMQIPGVIVENLVSRDYPDGEVSAHIVGFTDIDNKGKEGMELAENDALTGKKGQRRVIRDRHRRVVDSVWSQEALSGEDVVLSIDSRLQFTAFEELKKTVEKYQAKAGSIMVADVQTGEILSMVNWPSYDQNMRRVMKMETIRNRALTDMFEPGSTMKPFAVAKALDMGLFRPDTLVDTSPGYLTIGNHTISDDNHDYGLLSVSEVISKSSNVGTTLIASKVSREALWEMYSNLGFGRVPDIGLPGATRGRLRAAEKWGRIDQATISYGHGVSVSLAQMVRAYTALARNGDVIDLSIKKVDKRPVGQQVFRPEIARQMRQMMMNTVKVGGTARYVSVQGYTVAGKTGTANKVENGRYVNKFVSSFIGMAPATQPRLIVAVVIDEPSKRSYYGGTVSASAFNAVTASALRLIGENPDDPSVASRSGVFVRGSVND